MRPSGSGVRRTVTTVRAAVCAAGLATLMAVAPVPVQSQAHAQGQAPGAQDAPRRDGLVHRGEFGLYSLPAQSGLVSDHTGPVPRLAERNFPLGASPPYQNAQSYWNRDLFRWCVYTGVGFGGIRTWVAPGMTGETPQDARGRIAAIRPAPGDQC